MLSGVWNAIGYKGEMEKMQAIWIQWQQKQPKDHFKRSIIYEHYKKSVKIPWDVSAAEFSVMSTKALTATETHYEYCFGDFYTFFIPTDRDIGIFGMFEKLLEMYDVCKGYSRVLFGDTEAISDLRKMTEAKDEKAIKIFDFTQYVYDYDRIHAHTVACFSLSTLVMTIASNYIGRKVINHPQLHIVINFERCKHAYESAAFGLPEEIVSMKTAPIDIIPNYRLHGSSRSLPIIKQTKCNSCGRLSEGMWGKFHCCLDCHLKKICSSCGANAQGTSANDDMPKCAFHLKMEEYG